MNFELEPVTAAGARLVELAEKHAVEFAATAGEYDRAGAFPFPHWEHLRGSGLLAGTVPAELGGLGVGSVQDLVVAVSRLARGDASIAIGVAMHLGAFWYFSRMPAAPAAMKLLLRRCARGRAVACVAISEPGTQIGWPRSTARPAGDGCRIDGRKTFCTNSPAATVFLSTVRIGDSDQLGFALIPRETAGVTVLDNWDSLGMRASGSNDVRYESCRVPDGMVVPAGPLGQLPTAMLPFTMAGALLLVGAALGIAERAQELTAQPAAGRPVRPEVARLVAENEVDLAVSRAAVGRVAALLDKHLPGEPPGPRLHELMSQVQCVNVAVKRAAIAIVDRALTVSGGRGYLSSSPLSRLYRDVRAGPFMQPFSALDAGEYIGRIRLGLEHT
jgi:alkylation response protein AidB-like acyl-CoA dehydrogenase